MSEQDSAIIPTVAEPSTYRQSTSVRTVKNMDSDAQPREKALAYGIRSLTNAELFAIILRTGTVGLPITTLCENLMQTHANRIQNLERAPREQFMTIDGIGTAKALQIEAVMEIVRRYHKETALQLKQIRSAQDIYDYMRHDLGNLPHEEIWAIFLSRANKVIAKSRITVGSATATVFDVKKIMRLALFSQAEGLILCHNHPSGTVKPSGQDDIITRKLKQACEAMDVMLLDHVILTADSYFSYADSTSIIR